MRNVAKQYLNAGISVLPINSDGTKRPAVNSWGEYQKSYIKDLAPFEGKWIAAITGQVSKGLNLIDFDNHFGDIDEVFKRYTSIKEVREIIEKYNLPIETTLRGGFHLFYRCENTPGNQKYARRLKDNKPVTVIESRGEGGYVVCYPSPGYNLINLEILEDGCTSKDVQTLCNIATISTEEQDILISYAKTFNEVVEKQETVRVKTSSGKRPGDEFAQSTDGAQRAVKALKLAGWTNPHGKYWTRPDKRRGVSATIGGKYDGYFHCFTSNGYPFEEGHAYDFFQVVALLEFNGDFQALAKELASQGYGEQQYSEAVVKTYSQVMTAIRKDEPVDFKKLASQNGCTEEELKVFYEDQKEKNISLVGTDNLPDIEKAERFLNSNYEFRNDIISKLPFMRYQGGDWEPANIDTVYRLIQKNGLKFSFEKLKSLLRSDFVQKWDPFVEYFGNLPEWDKKDRIKDLCDHFYLKDNENDFFYQMFKKMLVRAVKCALDSTYYNRIVLTFVGSQNIGKSFFWRWLNPFGNEYYSEESLRDNKDSRLALTENFLYNLEELDTLSKFDVGKLKATISTQQVNDRLPFATHKERFFRCCTFVGSTNRDDFLVDDKNTRWLCFNVTELKWSYTEIDKTQLWAQVMDMYLNDFDCELNKEEAEKRDARNENFESQPFEELMIKKYLKESEENFMDNAEILDIIQYNSPNIKLNCTTQAIGKALLKCGFKKGVKKITGTRQNRRGWFVELKRTKDAEAGYTVKDDEKDIPF
jgi:predicted P-loop ATPase